MTPNGQDSLMQRANRHFLHLAEKIPEFGGIYLEEKATRLVIRVTEPDKIDKANARQITRSYLSAEAPAAGSAVPGGVNAMEIILQDASFTFSELYEWRNKLNGSVFRIEGVTSIGLSQKNNKIRIGIEEREYKDRVYELIGEHDVPEEAVMVSVTGPYTHLSGHALRDMHRPLVGGLQNIGYENGSPLHGGCTYSFNAYWQNDRHWLTNSHCTREMWSVNSSDQYYQSSDNDGSSAFIGYEVYDPQTWSCPGYINRDCRYSDAALLELPTDQAWDYGEIARTESGSAPGQGRGSIDFHSEDDRFVIVDERENFFEGMAVSKMGRTSGWTFGEITATCTNVEQAGTTNIIVCQALTNFHVEAGDSGAPVFTVSQDPPTEVTLNGILWGGSTEEGVFSPMDNIRDDLGELHVVKGDAPAPSAPFLFHSMDGCHPHLNWSGVTGAESYEVFRLWADIGGWHEVATTTSTQFTDQNACDSSWQPLSSGDSGTEVTYKVRAIGFEGQEGDFSGERPFGEEGDDGPKNNN